MSTQNTYEVYAIRYAVNENRVRSQNFVRDSNPAEKLQLDFFTWVVIGTECTFVIDTGMRKDTAEQHGHNFLCCPAEALRKLGVSPEDVKDVVLTHMHYDHIGNVDKFPNAHFHLHDAEMAFATGRHMRHQWMRRAYLAEEVAGMVHYVHGGRVRFHDSDTELAPGLSVHWAGGHTAGQEFVRVHTKRGWVVLASDAIHYYEEIERTIPFAVVFNIGEMLDAHDSMRKMAESPDHIIPGHDPLVMARYPAPNDDLEGMIVRLDVDPVST